MFSLVTLTLLFFNFQSFAEEGMWTIDNLPNAKLEKQYGFKATPQWREQVQLSSVRLANGCSGSFISKEGLVMTNHHCARGCIQDLSTDKKDYINNGFHAKSKNEEKQCPAFEVNRLVDITDVTDQVLNATKGKDGKEYSEAKKATMAQMEKACSTDAENFRCDTVSLYHGGQYKMYKYRRFQDVRLVFAPEDNISKFGGDPDNFNFPRFALDMTLLRVYENGKPMENKHWFSWSTKGIQDGEMTFITGHPGSTSRLEPISFLEYLRDEQLVQSLVTLAETRGLLHQYAKKGSEFQRTSKATLNSVENRFKALTGRLKALQDKKFFSQLVKKEKELRYRVNNNRWFKNKYASAWNEIEKAIELQKNNSDEISYIAFSNYGSELFDIARTLVRAAEELKKPNEKRLREFSDAKIPRLKQQLFSQAPIYNDFEKVMMEFSLTKMREHLSPDHPFVKKVLGLKSPEEIAKSMVDGSQLKSIKERQRLFDGGLKAIQESKDSMIQLALKIDGDSRKIRQLAEETIEPLFEKNKEKIAQAIFDIHGSDNYPDATFSLRVSYGKVKGFSEKGKWITPFTDIKGVFSRQTGSDPFELPNSWLKAKSKLNLSTPFNFVSTNDIIGGNSGSPVINKNAEIVGLVFDGNIHSLGGAYGFNEAQNRAVSVHSSLIMEALEKVYDAQSIVKEIKGSSL